MRKTAAPGPRPRRGCRAPPCRPADLRRLRGRLHVMDGASVCRQRGRPGRPARRPLVVEDARPATAHDLAELQLHQARARQTCEKVDAVLASLLDAGLVTVSHPRFTRSAPASVPLDRSACAARSTCLRLNTLSRCWITRFARPAARWVSAGGDSTSACRGAVAGGLLADGCRRRLEEEEIRVAGLLQRPYAIAARRLRGAAFPSRWRAYPCRVEGERAEVAWPSRRPRGRS